MPKFNYHRVARIITTETTEFTVEAVTQEEADRMKRRITLVAGYHLTATDKAYINAILDAGEQTGHRKGGLTVTLERADRQTEIDRYRSSMLRKTWADDIEKHMTKGLLYAVEIKDRDHHTIRQIIDVTEFE